MGIAAKYVRIRKKNGKSQQRRIREKANNVRMKKKRIRKKSKTERFRKKPNPSQKRFEIVSLKMLTIQHKKMKK